MYLVCTCLRIGVCNVGTRARDLLPQPVSGRIAVPHMSDDVLGLSAREKELLEGVTFDVDRYRKSRGLPGLAVRTKYDVLSRRWCEPALTVHSISTSVVNSSVIPRSATGELVALHTTY